MPPQSVSGGLREWRVAAIAIAALLAGCGQTGPLTLPPDTAPQNVEAPAIDD